MGLVCLPKFTIKKSTIHVGKMEHKSGRNATLIFIFLIPKDPCMVYLPTFGWFFMVNQLVNIPFVPWILGVSNSSGSMNHRACFRAFRPRSKACTFSAAWRSDRGEIGYQHIKTNDSPKKFLLSIAICSLSAESYQRSLIRLVTSPKICGWSIWKVNNVPIEPQLLLMVQTSGKHTSCTIVLCHYYLGRFYNGVRWCSSPDFWTINVVWTIKCRTQQANSPKRFNGPTTSTFSRPISEALEKTTWKKKVGNKHTWLVVSTHLKNMLVKLDHFPR